MATALPDLPRVLEARFKALTASGARPVLWNRNIKRSLMFGTLGVPGVGKSSLCIRFFQDVWVEEYDPTIEDVFTKEIQVAAAAGSKGPVKILLDVYDTAGREETWIRRMEDAQVYGEVVLIFYAVDDASSFDQAKKYVDQYFSVLSDVPAEHRGILVLVETKSDLEKQRCVSVADAQALADQHGMLWFSTSAKQGTGIDQLFADAARASLDRVYSAPGSRAGRFSKNKPGRCAVS